MTVADARVKVTLPDHPKTKKLIRKCGQAGAWNLIRLFLFAAANRPDGDLSGMDTEDLEIAADWQGDAGAFVAALVEVRFLSGADGEYVIHDWAEHNPWASGSNARAEKSRWAALCKQHGRPKAAEMMPEYAESLRPACQPYASRVPDSASGTPLARSGSAPSPSPSPLPNQDQEQKHERVPRSVSRFADFWQAYPNKKGKADAEKAWKRKGLDAQADLILADVHRRQQQDRDWLRGYIPHGSTYVNAEGWLDGLPPTPLPQQAAPMQPSRQMQAIQNLLGVTHENDHAARLVPLDAYDLDGSDLRALPAGFARC